MMQIRDRSAENIKHNALDVRCAMNLQKHTGNTAANVEQTMQRQEKNSRKSLSHATIEYIVNAQEYDIRQLLMKKGISSYSTIKNQKVTSIACLFKEREDIKQVKTSNLVVNLQNK